MGECPECARAEMTRRQRAMADLRKLVERPSPFEAFFQGYATTMAIMTGTTQREPTWYEKHRDRWVETGDVAELDRMTRHVVGG